MKFELFSIKNKYQDLSYTYTLSGVELPVLDITHPQFISSIDEAKLNEMLVKAAKDADKNAEKHVTTWII